MLDDLIERLKGATEGSGGLDGLVWEATGHCAHRETKYYAVQSDTGFECTACGIDMYGVTIPKVTTDLNAALALVEEKAEEAFGDFVLIGVHRDRHKVPFDGPLQGKYRWTGWLRLHAQDAVEAHSYAGPEIALLIALLTALKEQNNG